MRNLSAEGARQQMLETNLRQRDFYESRYEANQVGKPVAERAANPATNAWTRLRRKINAIRASAGVDERIYALHQEWMRNIKNAHALDLGCFDGNRLSLWIAANCGEYDGIDLSVQATAALDAKLRERGLTHARAYAQDFLANSYPDNHFDLVYAYSVLHHFEDMTVMLEELHRILKPGGVVISMDPMQTEPMNRLARRLYRPLQTDKDWEWPFSRATFRLIRKYFEIADMQGLQGMVKLGYPFQILPGLGGLGRAIGRWGLNFDNRHARKPGIPFYLCWHATLLLRKPDSIPN